MTRTSLPPLHRRAVLAGLVAAPLAARAAAPRGFEAAGLSAALDRARGLDQLHAVVIGRDGAVAAAERVRGPALSRPANVKSVSKTLVAALTGAAVDRGALPGIDATLAEVAPALIPAGADPRVREITVENLLSMTAGLERTSGRNYGGWVASRDWVRDALSRPFVDDPGGRFLYSTGSFHILGAALSEATGRSLLTLARDWLGDPLGVEIPPWTRSPAGRYMGGNQMALTPAAMWRFGEMHRAGGVFDGARALSSGWIEDAWTPRARSPWSGHAYGLGWFLYREPQGRLVAYARGYGGQMIHVIPEAGVVVAITSDPTRPARSAGYAGDLQRLVTEAILPAADAA